MKKNCKECESDIMDKYADIAIKYDRAQEQIKLLTECMDTKFDNKEYCTLHNELCEDLSFACDKNCQVYEDYKKLVKANELIDYIATKCSYAKGYRHLSSLMPTIYDIEKKIKEYKNANKRPD